MGEVEKMNVLQTALLPRRRQRQEKALRGKFADFRAHRHAGIDRKPVVHADVDARQRNIVDMLLRTVEASQHRTLRCQYQRRDVVAEFSGYDRARGGGTEAVATGIIGVKGRLVEILPNRIRLRGILL